VNAQHADMNGTGPVRRLLSDLPTDRLKEELEAFVEALMRRAVSAAAEQAGSAAERLTEYTARGGGPAVEAVSGAVRSAAKGKSPLRGLVTGGVSAVTGAMTKSLGKGGGGGGDGGQNLKVTNIVEDIDVGLPREVAYDLWTRFEDFPSYMKKVESVDQESDEEINWTAQVFFSHRTWRSTITEQVPGRRVVWQSEGDKGYVDGAVTFHSIAPDLTRILVVLEYNPRGFFEGTGNLWRAQGRRVRLELKHFRRHAMTQALLHPDEIDGWPGEIRDGEVVGDGDEAEDQAGREDEAAGEDEDEYADEYEDQEEDGDDEDGYEDEDEDEDEEDEDSRSGRDREPAAREDGAGRGRARGRVAARGR
jgi:uncharacterized membrane protein